ncbi:hypothetical protein L0F63_001740 [Massospora cicadina]|nr:hypothetical protein L0F63_001740 [Massospora cicadina]
MNHPHDKRMGGVTPTLYNYTSPSAKFIPTPEEIPRTRLSLTYRAHVSNAATLISRVTATGRSDDCHDIQHKKRGRPKTNPSSSATNSSLLSRMDVAGNGALEPVYPTSHCHRLSRNKRLSPLLPLFEPKHDPRSFLNLLHPRIAPSSPTHMPSLVLTLNAAARCQQLVDLKRFIGIDTDQLARTSLYEFIHPNDHAKLTEALQTIASRRITANSTPTSQVRVHMLGNNGYHELVDMKITPGLEKESMVCEITKFDLDALLRQAPPGDISLFL